MLTELFDIELFICIKMDFCINNMQWVIGHKTKPIHERFLLFLIVPQPK